MNSNKEENKKELNTLIPLCIREKILTCGATEEHFEKVYRVAKWGKLEEKGFISTFEEIREGILPDDTEKYPRNKVGTYSTSVYTDRRNCDKFINLLKGKLRKIYPCPTVVYGNTSHGLVQRTVERETEYSDPTHVDWWIYDGKVAEVVKDFQMCEKKG